MVEKSGADFVLEHIYPPSPATTRGYGTVICVNPEKNVLAYSVSNVLVLRSLKDTTTCDIFTENKNNVTACRYSPNGKYLATGDSNGVVIIFENIPQKPIKKTYEGVLNGVVRDLAFTGDNQRIVVTGEGKQHFAKVFLVDSGSSVGDLSLMSKIGLSCDLKVERPYRLAMGGEEMILYFYESVPFKFKVSNKNHKNYINCVRYNPSNSKFASASSDKSVIIYNGTTGEEVLVISNEKDGHTGAINHLSWLDDINFVTCSNDKTVCVWESESGKLLKKFKVSDDPQVSDMQMGIATAGDDIISLSLSGALNIWRKSSALESGSMPTERIVGHQGTINYLLFNKGTKKLLSADNNGRLIVWNDRTGAIPSGKQHTLSVEKIVQTAEPNFVLTLGKDGFVRRLDVANCAFDQETPKITRNAIDLAASRSNSDVFHVLFEDREVITYEKFAEKSSTKLAFEPSAFDVTSNDGTLVIGDVDGLVHIVEAGGKEVGVLKAYAAKITVVKLNSDDTRLVCGDSGFKLKFWDFAARAELTDRWVYHSGKINAVAFSQSEDYLLSVGIDNRFCVWNTKTFEKEAEFENAHKRGIYACTFDENGRIITGGGDCLIKVNSFKNKAFK